MRHKEGVCIVKLKEILVMVLMTIFANWFVIKILGIYESVIKPTELMWILGFFTGTVATKLLTELSEKQTYPNNRKELMQLLQRCEYFDQSLNMMEPSFIQSKLVVDMPVIIKQVKELLKED